MATYGRLTTTGNRKIKRFTSRTASYIECVCECGTTKYIAQGALISGVTKSCGCLARERRLAALTTHGATHTDTYKRWNGMITRCKTGKYKGRFTVCDRWLDYANFLEDMGERPAGKTLDRIDNNGNYEPSNCRWATPLQQAQNTSANINVTIDGKTHCLREWCRIYQLNHASIYTRIHKGWSPLDAITIPIGTRRTINHG